MSVLTLLLYEPADGPETRLDDLAEELSAIPGMTLDGAAGAAYRPGQWRDPATGAICVVDLGEPELEADTMHPPTTYLGWRAIGVALHLPLFAPHWHCVEALRMIDGLLQAQPSLAVLDSEDTRAEEGGEAGPFPLNRPRVLANWERLHAADCAGRADVYRMDRLASLALWRYRRERSAGLAAMPELAWPEALALLDERTARSAAFWNDPGRGLALPPVELVIVRRGDGAGVLPSDEVLIAAGGGAPLAHGKAVAILPGPRLADLHAKAKLLPIARFKALSDQDWSD